jgi:hypothetical protein
LPPSQAASSRSRTRSRITAAATLVTLTLVAGGCSSSDSSSPSANPSPTGTPLAGGNAGQATSTVLLGKVAGTIKKKNWKTFMKDHRKTMLKQVGTAVDTWIDGGFVGVDYPRDSFDAAFDSFTGAARHDADRQRKLMTNWQLRSDIDGVEVKKRRVTVDVLAPRGRPAGATARVHLVFVTSGDTTERVTVRGRLFLSPAPGKWQIFGYDVSKGAKG